MRRRSRFRHRAILAAAFLLPMGVVLGIEIQGATRLVDQERDGTAVASHSHSPDEVIGLQGEVEIKTLSTLSQPFDAD